MGARLYLGWPQGPFPPLNGALPLSQIARGPVQVLLGAAGGAGLGFMLSATRLWASERLRLLATYSSW
jgi:hypothetical protein